MPQNVRIHKRFWDQEHSTVRAHSGSADINLGGDSGNVFARGAWAPPFEYFKQIFQTNGNQATIQATSLFEPEINSSTPGAIITQNGLQIVNIGPGEAYTAPYELEFGAVVCETGPGQAWEWSIEYMNNIHNGLPTGFTQTLDGIMPDISVWIFALDETGNAVGGASHALGSEGYSGDTIPTVFGGYQIQSPPLPYSYDGTHKITGRARFVLNDAIRYLSMRIDVNGGPANVGFTNLQLLPLDQKRSNRPLLWNSPRIFKTQENLNWGIASTENTAIGNGTPYEYLRLSFGDHPDDFALTDYLQEKGLRGWRYGSTGATGGTVLAYPSGRTSVGSFDATNVNYNNSSGKPTYGHWLIRNGITPSNTNTGPENGPMTYPDFEFFGNNYRHHFGWKQDREPYGRFAAGHLKATYHNYLYVETSSGRKDRNILQLPKINFNATTREETLSFYVHSFGSTMGDLNFYYQTDSNAFYLPEDGTPHTSVTNIPGLGVAAPLTNVKRYSSFVSAGFFQAEFLQTSYNSWFTQNQSARTDDWHRVEVDLSEVRGLNVHILIMYSGATDYRGDIAISNIRVAGLNNTHVPQVLGCTNPNAENYNANATQDDGSCEFTEIETDISAE